MTSDKKFVWVMGASAGMIALVGVLLGRAQVGDWLWVLSASPIPIWLCAAVVSERGIEHGAFREHLWRLLPAHLGFFTVSAVAAYHWWALGGQGSHENWAGVVAFLIWTLHVAALLLLGLVLVIFRSTRPAGQQVFVALAVYVLSLVAGLLSSAVFT